MILQRITILLMKWHYKYLTRNSEIERIQCLLASKLCQYVFKRELALAIHNETETGTTAILHCIRKVITLNHSSKITIAGTH